MRAGRIVFLSKGRRAASTRYRALQYLPLWRESGWRVSHVRMRGGWRGWLRTLAAARRGDVVVVLRRSPAWPWRWLLQRAARRGGGVLVFDFDDAVFVGQRGAGSGLADRDGGGRWRVSGGGSRTRWGRFAAMLGGCDAVWAGNAYLASTARGVVRAGVGLAVLPTALEPGDYEPGDYESGDDESRDDEARDDEAGGGGAMRLVWVGSASTRGYLAGAMDGLAAAADRLGGLALTVVADFELAGRGGLVVENVRWSPVAERAALAGADVGIAPMPDDVWTRGKCGFKVLQYMAAGLPVVASRCGVHPEIVAEGETGLLVAAGDDGGWGVAMARLAGDAGLRRRMGAAGRAVVEARYARRVVFAKQLAVVERVWGEVGG